MASIFKRKDIPNGSYRARIKKIDPNTGKASWVTVKTNTHDPKEAILVAKKMEAFVNQGIQEGITKSQAQEMVETLLKIIGSKTKITVPSLAQYGSNFIEERVQAVAEATGRIYRAHWKRFKKWSADKLDLPMDSWDKEDFKAYYKDLRAEFSNSTANAHFQTIASIYKQAHTEGVVNANLVALVTRESNQSAQKSDIIRAEMVALIRYLRKHKYNKWIMLSLLGWHTGHRFEDLQNLKSEHVIWRGDKVGFVIEIKPAKKESRGGRTLELPIPTYVAKRLQRLGDAYVGDNRNGNISKRFIQHLERAGIDVQRIKRGKREFSLKSFHSFRHAMASRLAAAGISGNIARLITDHDSEKVHNRYVHAEVESIAKALRKIR